MRGITVPKRPIRPVGASSSRGQGSKQKTGFIGALLVVALLGLHSIEHWTIVDAVIVGLRQRGSLGVFVADLLLSPVVPLVIALTAIYLVFEGRKEKHDRKEKHEQTANPNPGTASVSGSGNSTATAQGGNVANYILLPESKTEAPVPPPAPAPKPEPRCNV